jgi:hypothetical protein
LSSSSSLTVINPNKFALIGCSLFCENKSGKNAIHLRFNEVVLGSTGATLSLPEIVLLRLDDALEVLVLLLASRQVLLQAMPTQSLLINLSEVNTML